jgi:putative nucleotidyltransferase with HDIG domain
MQNTKSKAHDLFLLMFNLSQITLKEKIIDIFIKAISEIWPDAVPSFCSSGSGSQGNLIPICASDNNYGFISIDNFSKLENDDQALIHNACEMLSIILRKNEQDKLLTYEKFHLQKLVEDKTRHLLREIEEHKQTSDLLRKSEYLLHSAGNMAKIGGWSVSIPAGFVIWSDEVAAIHEMPQGYSPTLEEAINFYAPEYRNKIRKVFNKCAQDGVSYDEELQMVTRTGRQIWVHAMGAAERDDYGKIIRVLGAFQDITSQKKDEEEIKKNLSKIKSTFEQTIAALSYLVEIRDPYTSGHQKRVADIAIAIAKDLKLSKGSIEAMRLASLIHDIGKISIPLSILSKPGKITDIEKALIQLHPITGYEIVKDIDFPYPIAKIIAQHHEKINGSGYPNGLKGKEILLEAKIITVADVIEAMTSHRPYRPALTLNDAKKELLDFRGILYEPKVVDSCIRIFNKQKKLKSKSNTGRKVLNSN